MANRTKKGSKKPKVSPIPKGFQTVTTSIVVRNAAQAIDYYKKAFGAKELFRMTLPDGNTIMHAEMKIGESVIMMTDEMPQMKTMSPQSIGGTSTSFYTYVRDVDKVFSQAVAAGATVTMPVMDAFWGDRMGQLMDPFGHLWSLATRKRNLSKKEMNSAAQEWMSQMAQQR
ncbi:MAG: VOC family protein [Nitrososphaera sp.]